MRNEQDDVIIKKTLETMDAYFQMKGTKGTN